ncbi:hypothetical protein BT96DRAFT_1004859 [Gymnopus androsaceus JB14]|uniref:Uncharacterized protein n=1 Tax=Gymnopus androsaceus JB14 TaxID=1447944 RepID=A0A6A4GPK6_9AGAR|nr:hypothetical protein BT96DRAFT_1004859 [Gymnopus androsaceus JB14]
MPPPPAPVTPSALGLTFSPPSGSAPSSHPQLAPGWVFPRTPARASQLPPPKTERQMDIYDRKVRLQGKLISLQGWGNVDAPASQQNEVQMLKEQIRRLELLENSDWAMGKSNELPSLDIIAIVYFPVTFVSSLHPDCCHFIVSARSNL